MSSFNDETQLPNGENIGFNRVVPTETQEINNPTFGETTAANFRQFNDIYRGVSWLSEFTDDRFRNTYEEGYNPVESGLLDQVPDEYWGRVLEASSYQEGQTIVKNINQELHDKDIRGRSGFVSNLVSTIGASVFSPTTLIPASQTIKYASVSKSAFATATNTAKVLGPAFALQNAILVNTKETEGAKEWIQDTLMDTFVASALGGALAGFASKGAEKQLNVAKGFFKAIENDIEIKYKLNEKGEVQGMLASPLDSSVGAAQVKTVQDLIDSGTVNFKDNKLISKTFGFAHPIIEGLTNRFGVVRAFTDDMFSHNFSVAGGVAGAIKDPAAENFVRLTKATFSNLQLMTKQSYQDFIGVKGPLKGAQSAVGQWSGKWMSETEFSELVGKAIRRDGVHEIPQVQDAAKAWIKEQYDPLWAELKKRRPDIPDHEYTNIARYLNRVYHKGKIQERPDDFVNDIVNYLGRGNEIIQSYRKPIDELKELRKGTKDKAVRKELKSKIDALEKRIEDDILNGKIGEEVLDSKPRINQDIIDKVEKLQKPIKDAKENLSNAKTKEERIAAREKLADAKRKLQDEIDEGKIDKALIVEKTKGKGRLIDITNKPKLRKVLSETQMKGLSNQIRDTVLQENEEQLVGKIFDSATSSGNNTLMARTLLWNDSQAEKWLVDDINVLGGLYMDQMSKRIYSDDVFMKYGVDSRDGMKGIVNLLRDEREALRNKILSKPDSPERVKELKALQKDFDSSEKYLTNSYKVYMGNYVDNTKAGARVANSIKLFTAGTMLGNVPILQLVDFFTPMFKFMFNEYIFDGLVPALNKFSAIAKRQIKEATGGSPERVRGNFADAGLGNNMAMGARNEALFGYGTQYQPKTLVERYVQNLSNLSSQVSLTNLVSDFQETAVAFASQSKTIRVLDRYLSGEKLLKEDIARLDILRLNPEKWAKRIKRQFDIHGEHLDGGFVANFHKWNDYEASQIFRSALEKDVRSVITKPNMLDIPFGMRDPVISVMTQFMSWTFASTLNFGLPTLTAGDKQKYIGIIMMMAGGALVDPLRQLAKGEEVNLDFNSLATSAMTNSGIFGWPFEALQKLNSALDIPLLQPFQADRFKRKGMASLLGGPALGLGDSILNLLSATVNGEMNERDAKTASRLLVPFSQSWYLRQPMDGIIKSFNMPENRQQAKRLKDFE